jgi:hypothetical protein
MAGLFVFVLLLVMYVILSCVVGAHDAGAAARIL